jgi:hypothetical protein
MMDKMWRRHEAHRKGNPMHKPKEGVWNSNAMEIDSTKKKTSEDRKCFRCGNSGHLIQNCQEKIKNREIIKKDF